MLVRILHSILKFVTGGETNRNFQYYPRENNIPSIIPAMTSSGSIM